MRSSSVDPFRNRAPLLVLGVGNTLLGDDGFGPAVIHQFILEGEEERWEGRAEFLDGGTQGLALLGTLSGHEGVIIVDAITMGAIPGTTRILNVSDVFRIGVSRAGTSHEGNAGELLAVAKVLDELPARVFILGIEPETIATGYGLSAPIRRALPSAANRIRILLAKLTSPSPRLQPEISPTIPA